MSPNEVLRRVYQLYPVMGAWVRLGPRAAAQAPIIETQLDRYFGPNAQDQIFESMHIRNGPDQVFLRDPETLAVMRRLLETILQQRPLVDGLFLEEP